VFYIIFDKKLGCRRGTARRDVSVKTVQNVAQMFDEISFVKVSLATAERPSRSFKVIANGTIQ